MATIRELIEQAETGSQDNKAKNAGFIIALPGELYTRTLSKHSVVYIERIGSQWHAWRETFQQGKERAVSFKVIETGETFEFVLIKTEQYFDFIARKRSG